MQKTDRKRGKACDLRRSPWPRYDRRTNEPCNCKRVPVTWNRMKRWLLDAARPWRASVKNCCLRGEIRLALAVTGDRHFLNANYSALWHDGERATRTTPDDDNNLSRIVVRLVNTPFANFHKLFTDDNAIISSTIGSLSRNSKIWDFSESSNLHYFQNIFGFLFFFNRTERSELELD